MGGPQKRSSLHSQVFLSGRNRSNTPLAPALSAALSSTSYRPQGGPSVSFAARAALDPDNPEASLEMFRRLSRRGSERNSSLATKSERRAGDPDGARHSESGTATPASEGSLLDLLEEGWSRPHSTEPSQAPSAHRPAAAAAPLGQADASSSAFAAPALQQAFQQGSRDASPLPSPHSGQALSPGSRPELLHLPSSRLGSPGAPSHLNVPLRLDSSNSTAADTAYYYGSATPPVHLDGGTDTPHSAASWTSALSSLLTLPVTESDLQKMDLQEVEALAAEAAELQATAGAALRLARQRMRAGSGGSGGSGNGSSTISSSGFTPASLFQLQPAGSRPSSAQLVHVPEGDSACEEALDAKHPVAQTAAVPTEAAGVKALPAAAQAPCRELVASAKVPQMAMGQAAAPKSPGSPPTAGAKEARCLPAALQLVLQLYLLLVAAAEAALLSGARCMQAASCGLVRLPRSLVLAPVSVAQAVLLPLLVALDMLLHVVAVLCGRGTAAVHR